MLGTGGGATADAEAVRRRLDAVLRQGPSGTATPLGPDDLDEDELDEDELDDDELDDDERDRSTGRPAGRRPAGRRRRGRHVEDGDLAEGLGLWPQLVGALADRVPVAVRHGRWGVSGPVVAAVLVVAAVVVLVLAVRSSAGAPGLPVPVRGGSTPTAATPAEPTADRATSTTAGSAGAEGMDQSRPASTTRPSPATASSATAVPGAGAVPAPASPLAGEVVVHVVGRVVRAGVVRLPSGSRVGDALDAAGGAAPDADLARVNLARPLVDGEQVVVPAPGEELATAPPQVPAAAPPGSTTAAGGAAGGGTELVDLNAATEADLDALPGIGPVLAQRILDVRAQLGSFTSVEELAEVSGIGDARLSELRELVVVA